MVRYCAVRNALSINTDTHKETVMFKKVTSSIWDFFCAVGRARYAAELARNGKWREAQEYAQK